MKLNKNNKKKGLERSALLLTVIQRGKEKMLALMRAVEGLVRVGVAMVGKAYQLAHAVVNYIKNKTLQCCSRFLIEG